MSALQESGSTLQSIIRSYPEASRGWESASPEMPPAQMYAKFWGKSIADEEQRWRAQSPMPVEGTMDMGVGEEEDDIIEGCCFLELGINTDDLEIDRIWIRAEYIRIYNAVESWHRQAYKRAPAVVITGQPGIGKSLWIFYALRRRLAERKPVIWYLYQKRFLFVEEGVYQVPDDFYGFKGFIWTLVDSDENPDMVPPYLVTHNTRHFVIYCTSPSRKRWSRLHKTVEDIYLIMNPWKSKEILRVVDTLPPARKVDRGSAIDVFDQFGPIPRLCIDNMRSPSRMEEYKTEVEQAIKNLTLDQLRQLIRDTGSLTMDLISPKICLISRQDREDVHSLAVVSPITSHIQSRLANHFRTLQHREQIDLYESLSKVPYSRQMAGVFFEAAAQQRFQGGVNLEFIPMVQEASSTSGKPRWHSSHVEFPNDAELEHSRQQALKMGQRLAIPGGLPIVQYTKKGPPSPIRSNVIYVPESTNQVTPASDSFIVKDNLLYIFQFTIAEQHEIKAGLIDFAQRYPELPDMRNWRFIFILPPDHVLICPPGKLEKLQPYSAVINFEAASRLELWKLWLSKWLLSS